ncbi:MAG: L,D-transpeptidase family protein [Sulfurovum sp.]|nr:L,D-transpeptidase family protein [Sulfurovum sp.]
MPQLRQRVNLSMLSLLSTPFGVLPSLFFFTLPFALLFTACTSSVPKDRYTLDVCKEELLNATDYKVATGIDKILVLKKERKMYLYKQGFVVKTLPISLGKNPIGHKEERGDNRTPEGEYFIYRKICSPKYYRSLCISYPRPSDKKSAKKRGVSAGGDITIHAQPKWNANGEQDTYTLSKDWTQGCVAVTNTAMKSLWYAVSEGVPITIR